jgi:hypothetical protein
MTTARAVEEHNRVGQSRGVGTGAPQNLCRKSNVVQKRVDKAKNISNILHWTIYSNLKFVYNFASLLLSIIC